MHTEKKRILELLSCSASQIRDNIYTRVVQLATLDVRASCLIKFNKSSSEPGLKLGISEIFCDQSM